MIGGLLPVIPTPIRGGRFDADSFERLLEHMLPWLDGYMLLGSCRGGSVRRVRARRS
jgi:hypothetical protein